MILLSILATLFFIVADEPHLAFGMAFAALVLFVRSIYADKAVYLLRIEEEKEAARKQEKEKYQKRYNELEFSIKEKLNAGEYLTTDSGRIITLKQHLNGSWEQTSTLKNGKLVPTVTVAPEVSRLA